MPAQTLIGTSIAEASINSTEVKKAEKDLKETLDCINHVHNTVQLWLDRKKEARLLYICCLAIQTLELSDPLVRLLKQVVTQFTSVPPLIVEAATRIFVEVGEHCARDAGKACVNATGQAGAKAAGKSGVKVAGRTSAQVARRTSLLYR